MASPTEPSTATTNDETPTTDFHTPDADSGCGDTLIQTPSKRGTAKAPPAVTEPSKRRKVDIERLPVDSMKTKDALSSLLDTSGGMEGGDYEDKVKTIVHGVRQIFEELTKDATEAFLALEKTNHQLLLTKEELIAKTAENQRLVANETASRNALEKLMQKVTQAKEQSHEIARVTGALGSLRGEHAILLQKFNDQVAELESYKRKCALIKEDLAKTAQLYSQVREEYSKLQRDHRQVMTFQDKEDKRRKSEDEITKAIQSKLQVEIQMLKTTLQEKERDIQEARTKLDRFEQKRKSLEATPQDEGIRVMGE